MTSSLGALVASQVRQRGDQPYLTYYDDTTGERTELGYATFENWVTKTANLLADRGVEPGDRVVIATGGHWAGLVSVFACGLVGAVACALERLPSRAQDASLALLGEDYGRGLPVPALVVGRGLGGRLLQPQDEVEPYAEEVLGHDDVYEDPRVDGESAWLELALDAGGSLRANETPKAVRLTQRQALQAVEGLGSTVTRALCAGTLDRGETVLAAVALFAAGGSLITVRDGDQATHERVAADERSTTTVTDIAAAAADAARRIGTRE